MKTPVIVDIPEKMEKFFGQKGTMLHPEMDRIENLIRLVPQGKFVTLNTLTNKMAKDVHADVVCPMRTVNAVKKIIEKYVDNSNDSVPFWRVVNNNHEIINSKYHDHCISKLEDEGFRLSHAKPNKIMVDLDNAQLFIF